MLLHVTGVHSYLIQNVINTLWCEADHRRRQRRKTYLLSSLSLQPFPPHTDSGCYWAIHLVFTEVSLQVFIAVMSFAQHVSAVTFSSLLLFQLSDTILIIGHLKSLLGSHWGNIMFLPNHQRFVEHYQLIKKRKLMELPSECTDLTSNTSVQAWFGLFIVHEILVSSVLSYEEQ